jgi:hypothetical protein
LAAEAKIARVEALVPVWANEPEGCDPAHHCDEAGKGCGAASCFANELMAALYGEDESKWPMPRKYYISRRRQSHEHAPSRERTRKPGR